ncbi:MAG: hypothetical protein ACYSR7_01670 [Planctomycetota bacterium]|jgi:hypothetical protein
MQDVKQLTSSEMKLLERLISKINGEYTDIIEIYVNHQITYRKKKVRKVESNNQEK